MDKLEEVMGSYDLGPWRIVEGIIMEQHRDPRSGYIDYHIETEGKQILLRVLEAQPGHYPDELGSRIRVGIFDDTEKEGIDAEMEVYGKEQYIGLYGCMIDPKLIEPETEEDFSQRTQRIFAPVQD